MLLLPAVTGITPPEAGGQGSAWHMHACRQHHYRSSARDRQLYKSFIPSAFEQLNLEVYFETRTLLLRGSFLERNKARLCRSGDTESWSDHLID